MFVRKWESGGCEHKIIIALYVDDIMGASTHPEDQDQFLSELRQRFTVRDETQSGEGWILNMKYTYPPDRSTVVISQEAAITALVRKYGLDQERLRARDLFETPMAQGTRLEPNEGDPVPTDEFNYPSLVGACLYLAQATRPDIAYAVMSLARFVNNPGKPHVKAARHLLRYLWRTRDLGLRYCRYPNNHVVRFESFESHSTASPADRSQKWNEGTPEFDPGLQENYSDASYGGSYDGRSVTGFVFLLCGGAVKWGSKLQAVTALSTAESELYAVTEATKEALFLRTLLSELGHSDLSKPARMYEDNSACIAQGMSLKARSKAKHYVLRLRFLQERVARGEIYLVHCPTTRMVADAFTKQLELNQFQRLRDHMLGWRRLDQQEDAKAGGSSTSF